MAKLMHDCFQTDILPFSYLAMIHATRMKSMYISLHNVFFYMVLFLFWNAHVFLDHVFMFRLWITSRTLG